VKKLFILFAFALIISECDKDSKSSSDTSFRIKSGTLTKFASPVTPYYTNQGNGNYAIIYNGSINGTNYIGIALSNDPVPATSYIKIYYQGNSITNVSLIGGTSPGFKVIHDGTDQTGAGTYNFIFTQNTVGTYTTYTIEITGSGYLTTTGPNHITALHVGAN
jgi:hypothetical protein